MKKVLSFMLCAVMLFGLCACTSSIDRVAGTWYSAVPRTADDTLENLSQICEFYDDEVAYAKLSGCSFVEVFTIDAKGTYTMGLDYDRSYASLRAYLKDFMETLYLYRTEITEYEGYADDIASAEEFGQWYVESFYYSSFTSYDEMLDSMTEEVLSYYSFTLETGEMKVSSTELGFKESGDTDFAYADYSLSGDVLTVKYSNNTVQYTK